MAKYGESDPDDVDVVPLVDVDEPVANPFRDAPTDENLRRFIWQNLSEEDFRKAVRSITLRAILGQPTAMRLFVELTGIAKLPEKSNKTPAEEIADIVRQALQGGKKVKMRELEISNVPLSAQEIYSRLLGPAETEDVIDGRG